MFSWTLFSCHAKEENSICTKEQIKEFNSCEKGFNQNFEKFKNKYTNINIPDSALLVLRDVEQLSLEEIAEKHKLNLDQIDQLISAVCITFEVAKAYEKLDLKLNESDSIIKNEKL